MGQCNNNQSVKCIKCGSIIFKDHHLDLKVALLSHKCILEKTFWNEFKNLENSTIKSSESMIKAEMNSDKKINKKVTLIYI